jgi:long-chain acyl-CoA synthetase
LSTTYGLHRAVLLNRNGTALVFEDRRRTFAELADRVARLAGALRVLGIARGDRVAVLSLNQDRYTELFLGVAWAGAVIVPLNIRWSAPENEEALRDCRPKILFVDAAFAAMGSEIAERIGSLSVIYADDAPPLVRRRRRTTKVCSQALRLLRTPKRETTSLPASSTPAAPPGAPKA